MATIAGIAVDTVALFAVAGFGVWACSRKRNRGQHVEMNYYGKLPVQAKRTPVAYTQSYGDSYTRPELSSNLVSELGVAHEGERANFIST
jgi:hypothetical protein